MGVKRRLLRRDLLLEALPVITARSRDCGQVTPQRSVPKGTGCTTDSTTLLPPPLPSHNWKKRQSTNLANLCSSFLYPGPNLNSPRLSTLHLLSFNTHLLIPRLPGSLSGPLLPPQSKAAGSAFPARNNLSCYHSQLATQRAHSAVGHHSNPRTLQYTTLGV